MLTADHTYFYCSHSLSSWQRRTWAEPRPSEWTRRTTKEFTRMASQWMSRRSAVVTWFLRGRSVTRVPALTVHVAMIQLCHYYTAFQQSNAQNFPAYYQNLNSKSWEKFTDAVPSLVPNNTRLWKLLSLKAVFTNGMWTNGNSEKRNHYHWWVSKKIFCQKIK